MINVVGWYSENNIGDEAFRDVFTSQLGSTQEIIFTKQPNLAADTIILGGGGVVGGSYLTGLESYRGNLYAVGVDIPVNGPTWEKIKTLPFKKIYTRSKEYYQIAFKELYGTIEYIPDIAFSLFSGRNKSASLGTCGFVISLDLAKQGSIAGHIASLIDRLKSRFKKITFIIMYTGTDGDLEQTRQVATLAGCPHDFIIPKTPSETLEEIGKLDFLISMRFHGIIFSTLLGVPFIALSNKGKCSLFCEQEHLYEHFIELREAGDFKLLNRVEYLLKGYDAVTNKLLTISERNKKTVDRVFSRLKSRRVSSWVW